MKHQGCVTLANECLLTVDCETHHRGRHPTPFLCLRGVFFRFHMGTTDLFYLPVETICDGLKHFCEI